MSKFVRGMVLAGVAVGTAGLGMPVGVVAQDSPAGAAQESPSPQGYQTSTLTVKARIIILDVVVTDKKGNLVTRALTKDDFTVIEDSVPQTIRSFEGPEAHRMPASPDGKAIVKSAADLKKIGDAPVTLLVLDELNSRFEDMSFARQMMVKYLAAQPAVLKQPTSLLLASNTTFQQMHDYTQDRDALMLIVKKHIPDFPYKAEARTGPGAVERMAQNLAALQQIAQATSGTPGRKNLIWVGNGFPSADLVGMPNDEADLIEAAYRRCTARMLAARITMYSINPTADSSSTVEADDPDDLNQTGDMNPFGEGAISFQNFGPATGGIAYTGRNDLQNIIGEGIAKGQEYYTISYSPTNKSDDTVKFRNIKIVMKDRELRATTRDGYFPETKADLNPLMDKDMKAKQVKANLQLDISGALTTTISYNGLTLTATKVDGGKYNIHVAENGIVWSDADADGKQHEEATVAAAWYDAKGKLLGHVAREQTFPRSAAANAGATFQLPVTLPAGAVRVRFVVRDALGGRMGTVDVKGSN